MRNKCLALITLLFVAFSGFAQKANNDVKAQINDIKKKTNLYIYGEATAATAQDAQDLAEEILYDEINKWAATRKKLQGTSDFLINNKKSMVSSLATTRGNMFRCLMYVKKSDIQKADNADVVENTLPQQPAQRIRPQWNPSPPHRMPSIPMPCVNWPASATTSRSLPVPAK